MSTRRQLPRGFWTRGDGAQLLSTYQDDREVLTIIRQRYHFPVSHAAVQQARRRLMQRPTTDFDLTRSTFVTDLARIGAGILGEAVRLRLEQLQRERDEALAELRQLRDKYESEKRQYESQLRQLMMERAKNALAVTGE